MFFCVLFRKHTFCLSFSFLLIFVFSFSGCSSEENTLPTKQPSQNLENTEPYKGYIFSKAPRVIDLGDQPYWLPSSIITEVMRRDPILQEELARLGYTLKVHHFLKGTDVNYFMESQDLEVGIAGDMPAIIIASTKDVGLISTFKGPVSIVSKNIRELSELEGKKVGYAFGSNAHLYLLKTLFKNGINISEIDFIEIAITKMANALHRGDIDAYSTWELTPPTTMKVIQERMTTHKGISYGFLCVRNKFFQNNGEVVLHLLASQVRAIKWLKEGDDNLNLVTYWLYTELDEWGQKESPLPLNRLMRHVREAVKYILLAPHPKIYQDISRKGGVLYEEFIFLKEHEFIPDSSTFDTFSSNLKTNFFNAITKHPDHYRTYEPMTPRTPR